MLNAPIDSLPNTSSVTIRKFKSLGINTYWDLLNYFPSRYEDWRTSTIRGKILSGKQLYTRRGLKIQKFDFVGDRGALELTWYNQPYLLTVLKPGVDVAVCGEPKPFGRKIVMEPRAYEIIKDKTTIHTGRIIPIYPEKRGLSSRTLREKISYLLEKLQEESTDPEFLSPELVSQNQLEEEKTAYMNIHFPPDESRQRDARERLAFDELFTIQLSTSLIRQNWSRQTVTNSLKVNLFRAQIDRFVSRLPFQLTNAQKKVTGEILDDLERSNPMNRFLQGEVGSGKTVVAAIACYIAYLNGYQSLFMAPTEILALQHHQTLSKLLEAYGVKVGINAGSQKSNVKGQMSNVIVGTHALIQKKILFAKVGLVVIDEQHRFGVAQRALLKEKGTNPHLLTMTATPIPRTVALTLYGELDISVIDEMPRGRLTVKTSQ